MKLTNREKNMIFILVFIIIGWGGWQYLLMPIIESHKALEQEYETLLEEQMMLNQNLARAKSIEEDIEMSKQEIERISEQFYDIEYTDYFYNLVINKAKSHTIEVTNIALSDPIYTSVSGYEPTLDEVEYPLGTYQKETDKLLLGEEVEVGIAQEEVGLEETNDTDQIAQTSIQLIVKGRETDILQLIDTFSKMKEYTIVESYSMTEDEAGNATGQISLSFYGVDKIKGLNINDTEKE